MTRLAIVVVLLLMVADAFARFDRAPPMVEVSPPPPIRRAAAPRDTQENRLFAPCPITPWALPKHVMEHPV